MSDDYNEEELEAILNEEDSDEDADSIPDFDHRDIDGAPVFDEKKKNDKVKLKQNSSIFG